MPVLSTKRRGERRRGPKPFVPVVLEGGVLSLMLYLQSNIWRAIPFSRVRERGEGRPYDVAGVATAGVFDACDPVPLGIVTVRK